MREATSTVNSLFFFWSWHYGTQTYQEDLTWDIGRYKIHMPLISNVHTDRVN